MKILDWQQFPSAFLEPGGTIAGLALGTMPVAARVIEWGFDTTGVAKVEVTSHSGRAAGSQRRQHFALLDIQAGSTGGEEVGSVAADDFADFERRAGFRGTAAMAGTWRSCSRGNSSKDWQASCRWLRRVCV
jgi:hypothetical protein